MQLQTIQVGTVPAIKKDLLRIFPDKQGKRE
jgi:hypothetical protein